MSLELSGRDRALETLKFACQDQHVQNQQTFSADLRDHDPATLATIADECAATHEARATKYRTNPKYAGRAGVERYAAHEDQCARELRDLAAEYRAQE